MPEEIEIKLRVPPDAMRGVMRIAWLRDLASGPVKRSKLVSTYFDTGKFKLHDHGIALRLRREGRAWLQTIKADANGTAGAFGRRQWEWRVKGALPDLETTHETALAPLISDALKRKLRPVFQTVIRRTAIPVKSGGSILEIALDRGEIIAGGSKEPVGEIEIELKKGDPAEIVRLAEHLARTIPAAYEARTKPERGYGLAAGKSGKAFGGNPVVLAPTVTVEESFRTIGLNCLHHLTANERAVLQGDSKGIHQMRVGLRRLRAAISVFKDLLQDSRTEVIKAELKWLTEQLGPARDFDVFVRESVAPLSEDRHGALEIHVLKQDLEARRDVGFARAKAALESERYRKIALEVAFWLAGGEWSANPSPLSEARRRRPATSFAAEILTERTDKIVKKLRHLEKLDVLQRHRLRIAVKKLRYATEFFESLFTGSGAEERRKRLGRTLKELQDALGKLNDIGVQQKLAAEIMQSREQPEKLSKKAYAMGIVTGRSHVKFEACIAIAVRAGRRLSAARQFWQ
jgi:triphosphatase